MPDENGKLTTEEKQQVIAWLATHQNGPVVCPICKSEKWFVADHVIALHSQGQKVLLGIGNMNYPQIMLVSTDCGHTVLMNAVMIGLVPAAPPEQKSE